MRHGALVSHQQAYIGQTDIGLAKTGYSAMQALTHDADYTTVISSPLSRCAVFAKDFSVKHNLALQIDENLTEINFGDFEGKYATDLMNGEQASALKSWWDDMQNTAPPNGESLTTFNRRVIQAFNHIIETQSANQDKLLCITHGGVIRCLVCYLMQIPLSRLFDFTLARASLTRFIIDKENTMQARLIFLNKTIHED